ncbi:MAG: Flp pilus assembly protein CpaB [Novosphingobium sp.]
MGQRNIIAIAAAIILGLIAVFLVNSYFSGVETRQAAIAQKQKMVRIAVASQSLAFGTALSPQNVRLVNWPAESVPDGAFTSVENAVNNRVALRPIVAGEPLLASKVSGTNGRATLSAQLPAGLLAYSIPISDVAGVAGFVRPGDVVDVLLTRPLPTATGGSSTEKISTIVLEAVPVLGIDQVLDDTKTDPVVGKTATLQVDTIGAQKLALSTQMGVMTLALRNVGDPAVGGHPTLSSRSLGGGPVYVQSAVGIPYRRTVPRMAAAPVLSVPSGQTTPIMPQITGPRMTVVRGVRTSEEGLLRGN